MVHLHTVSNGLKRWSNIRSLSEYINRIESNKNPVSFEESLQKKVIYLMKKIGFGLRMNSGINLGNLPENLMRNFRQQLKQTSISLLMYKKIKKNQLRLTEKGYQFSDLITSDLMI